MTLVAWIGVAMAAAGVGLLGWAIRRAARLKADKPGYDETQVELRTLIALNGAGVGVAFLGVGVLLVGLLI